jgi:hypothetical protein
VVVEVKTKMSVPWDPNHPKYHNKLHKDDAWVYRAKAIGTFSCECKKMTSLLSSFRRQREREREEYGRAVVQERYPENARR